MKVSLSVILIVSVFIILISHAFCGCYRFKLEGMDTLPKKKSEVKQVVSEGFTGLKKNIGQYAPYDIASDSTAINQSNWGQKDLTVTPGKPLSPAVKDFLNRPKQPVPLPEGQLSLFFNTEFKPECCPNTFSNSSGCACMTGEQYNWLILRGGNNVPYSGF